MFDGLDDGKVVNCAMSAQGLPPGLAGFLLLLVSARGFTQGWIDGVGCKCGWFKSMDLEVALAALFGYRQVAHWLYNLRGPTEYSCKVGVYHLLDYLGFEVYMAPSTLRIITL